MNLFDKWIERVYGETDFAKSIALSVSGIIGLCVYLLVSDWVIAGFASVIAFPLVRLIAAYCYERWRRSIQDKIDDQNAMDIYGRLSDSEQAVVQAFVAAGGSVLTYSQSDSLGLSASAFESLHQRQLITTSMTADGFREVFVLDPEVFTAGLRVAKKAEQSGGGRVPSASWDEILDSL